MLQEKFLQNFKHEVILFYFEQLIILKIRKVHENVKQKICIVIYFSNFLIYKFNYSRISFS